MPGANVRGDDPAKDKLAERRREGVRGDMSPIRYWCVTVAGNGERLTLPVYCTSLRVAMTIELNLPRMLAEIAPRDEFKVLAERVEPPVNPEWPVWTRVSTRRMTRDLSMLVRELDLGRLSARCGTSS